MAAKESRREMNRTERVRSSRASLLAAAVAPQVQVDTSPRKGKHSLGKSGLGFAGASLGCSYGHFHVDAEDPPLATRRLKA